MFHMRGAIKEEEVTKKEEENGIVLPMPDMGFLEKNKEFEEFPSFLKNGEKDKMGMYADMDKEQTLEAYEDFLIESLESVERKLKEAQKLSKKRVRKRHIKSCTKCGYSDWMMGEIYYAGDGPRWALSEEKFCRGCYREWMSEELPDKYVTSEMKELRDSLEGIEKYRREKYTAETGKKVALKRKRKKSENRGSNGTVKVLQKRRKIKKRKTRGKGAKKTGKEAGKNGGPAMQAKRKTEMRKAAAVTVKKREEVEHKLGPIT